MTVNGGWRLTMAETAPSGSGSARRRIGVSAYRRIGVWGSETAFRRGYRGQEHSKKLMTLFKRQDAEPPIRFP